MKILNLSLFFITGLLLFFSCSHRDDDSISNCRTESLGIDTTYRHTPTDAVNPDGTPVFSNNVWKWSVSNDTIIVGGSIEPYNDSVVEMCMFLKKNNDCINLLYTTKVFKDCMMFENGVLVHDSCSMDFLDNEFKRQTYIEDSILVGKVNDYKFWIEFSSQYHQSSPWGFEILQTP